MVVVIKESPNYIRNLTYISKPDSFIDTLHPWINESVFFPKIDFSPPAPKMINKTSARLIEYTPVEISQKIPIYADYSASPSTQVKIFSSVYGSNSWRYSDDSGAGNYYRDTYSFSNSGESHGWQIAYGTYKVAGEGFYPNFDNPEWEKVLNQTTT